MIAKRHRGLLIELVRREFAGRYQGSFGGVLWSFIQPLFLLSVYTLVFGVILQTRWGGSNGTAEYALFLFSGLIIFNAFSECMLKAPTTITGNPNFVKKVVFPLESLPLVTALAALLHACIGMLVWMLGYLLLFGLPPLTSLLFPLVFIGLLPLLLGVGWLLSAIGVLLRDVGQLTGMLNHMLLFLTPIFYSIDAVPPVLRTLLMLNPLTFLVEQFRLLLIMGQLPAPGGVLVFMLATTAFAAAALHLFRRLRPGFADLV